MKKVEMKKIMNRAWEIAREAAKVSGRAIEYIAAALRMAWAEARKPADITDRIDELTALGFSRWQKAGMDRMYINAGALGLICTYYKTGNISGAEFRGEHISNSEAYRMKAAKTYIDLKLRRIVSDSCVLAAAVADLIGVDDYRYGENIIAC
jgi:hypothetical protein